MPLCGKTKDLEYLSNHPNVSEVVGVEGVQKAIDEFIAENPTLEIKKSLHQKITSFIQHDGKKISLLKGDFFDLGLDKNGGSIPKFDLVWDRASIVAIEPKKRNDYINTISRVLNPGAVILCGSIDRREGTEAALNAGPPFSVTDQDLKKLYDAHIDSCEKLCEYNEMATDPASYQRFLDSGIKSIFEVVTMMKTK